MNKDDTITALMQAMVCAEMQRVAHRMVNNYIAGADPYDYTEYKRRKELLCLI